ncbi:ABC transporter ATP-binding protein [Chryseolinea sp. H1M3-3]|uniref:ABC transporter ATP-binding protein n=1 Tax=Chryseolinea sp. H1M3-3 TaxID=3034144 RepID=UPI0023ECC2B0|nr:ABC transporter ATP-binding protein [Chryseolinea sp. H1M3-3]
MSTGAIRLDSITKQYPNSAKRAVSELTLEIQEGSVFGLLGPNGAGKSTTVMMLCGLMRPDSGSISVFGTDVMENGADIRKHIGVAPQEIALFPTLTAYENLFYFGRMYGLKASEIRAQIKKYLQVFGLSEKGNKIVSTFSGGMKKRLNLIAALLHQPKLIILDEPTAGVDVQSRNMILDFLETLKKEGTTIIYSSHVLEEVERICSHLGIIDEGKLISTGTRTSIMGAHDDCKNLEQVFLKLTGKNIRD